MATRGGGIVSLLLLLLLSSASGSLRKSGVRVEASVVAGVGGGMC